MPDGWGTSYVKQAVDWAARSSIKGYTPATLMLADCYSGGVLNPQPYTLPLNPTPLTLDSKL